MRIILLIFSRRWIVATLLVLAGAALCVRLGFWQLDRLAQWRAANTHYQAMQAADPLTLPRDSAEELTTMEFRQALAAGRYDFSQQVALRNQVYEDQPGYHLLTPLVLPGGSAVLVDRGWIPSEGNASPAAWAQYNGPADVTIHGVVRASRASADLSGASDPALEPGQSRLDTWVFPNIPRLQEQMAYRLLPVYLQLAPVAEDSELPIPSQPDLELGEGPHQGYAIQWFSFAAMLIIGYPVYIHRHSTPLAARLAEAETA